MMPKNQTEKELLERLQKLEVACFDHTFEENYGEKADSQSEESDSSEPATD